MLITLHVHASSVETIFIIIIIITRLLPKLIYWLFPHTFLHLPRCFLLHSLNASHQTSVLVCSLCLAVILWPTAQMWKHLWRVSLLSRGACAERVILSSSSSLSSKLHGAAYGKGIYLSPISSISFGYSGTIQTRVFCVSLWVLHHISVSL